MSVPRRILLSAVGLVLIALLAWCGFTIKSAHEEASFRALLARYGERSTARVVEEGLSSPNGGYAQAWVELPSGQRVFVDLSDSITSVFRLGQELTVVVPPEKTPRDVALPIDVVEQPAFETYREKLTLPTLAAVLALALLGGLFKTLTPRLVKLRG